MPVVLLPSQGPLPTTTFSGTFFVTNFPVKTTTPLLFLITKIVIKVTKTILERTKKVK
jgi:hypothetical protein